MERGGESLHLRHQEEPPPRSQERSDLRPEVGPGCGRQGLRRQRPPFQRRLGSQAPGSSLRSVPRGSPAGGTEQVRTDWPRSVRACVLGSGGGFQKRGVRVRACMCACACVHVCACVSFSFLATEPFISEKVKAQLDGFLSFVWSCFRLSERETLFWSRSTPR